MQRYSCSTFAEPFARSALWVGVLLSAFAWYSPSAHAGFVYIDPSLGTNARVPVRSIRELKYRAVVKQQFDFSCGSAAVATLLTYHYRFPVSEQDVFMAMYQKGDQATIQREGFSLLDMKQYLDDRGYQANGIYAGLDDLERVGVPAIALIDLKGYNHFVVIKGVNKDEVMVGDPAVGLKLYRRAEFEKVWTSGILFVVTTRADIARQHFNSEWASIARAPVGDAIIRDTLSNITLLRPSSGDF